LIAQILGTPCHEPGNRECPLFGYTGAAHLEQIVSDVNLTKWKAAPGVGSNGS
jgi:hypothetical protein